MTADALYGDALRALAEAGRASGRLAAADATATVDNPLCGDRVTLDVALDGDRIAAVGHEVKGCLLCEAAAAVVAAEACGHGRAEIAAWPAQVKAYLKATDAPAPFDGLDAFAPARRFRSRHRCVSLAFEALARALA
ncbi:MAG: iron-sulfur cluster assembly scaffold protein [Alphaproteobacteria bacterium]|jgi:nitrogen fixation NifU-like protein|nr:iron-sulfur cluster assembly scaffold protein [Alphaproteobacteria bacterium]